MLEAGLLVLRIALAVALLSCLGQAVGSPLPETLSTVLRAVGTVSVVKYIYEYVPRYYLDDGLSYGQWYSVYPMLDAHEHGTAHFSLAPIPDTAFITAAEFGFYQYSDDTAGTPPYNVRAYDYGGEDAETLFNAVQNAETVSSDREAHQGWNRVPLNEAGVAALRSRLVPDVARIAIAEHNAWGELGYAYDHTAAESLRPYLLVSYEPTAVAEQPALDAERPELDVRPNPATGFVSVTLPGPQPGKAVLRLCDVSGRVAIERICRGASVRLDCSSLSPGAYVVRVEAGGVISGAVLRVLGR
jgi:hypothetical protein